MQWTVPTLLLFAGFIMDLVSAGNQCREERSIKGMALQGFIFKKFSVKAFHVCDISCERELICQSYNYVVEENSCELNNRTKEARPEHFLSDPARVYLRRLRNRAPLGSIAELPAHSCKEIKSSEGKGSIISKYWLDPYGNGTSVLVYCDMKLEVVCTDCKFDFERGINGWKRTGTVFNNQPTFDDNPTARNRGQPSNHQGDWWIGGYENRPSKEAEAGAIQGDIPKGTLTSPRFRIIGRNVSFLIGGGCDMTVVRAELLVNNKVVRTETGNCIETMSRRSWDVQDLIGQHAGVRLIDDSSEAWGHINFDDLKGDIICDTSLNG